MGGYLFEADFHGANVAIENGGAVLLLGQVALRGREAGDEVLLEIGGAFPEEVRRELEDAPGVGDDLHGLNAGDVVEEPATAGVHEHGVALELHEHEGAGAFVFVEFVERMLAKESLAGVARAVQHNVDVAVARGTGIFE